MSEFKQRPLRPGLERIQEEVASSPSNNLVTAFTEAFESGGPETILNLKKLINTMKQENQDLKSDNITLIS